MRLGKKIKLFDPHVGVSEKQAINRVLKSHFWASGSGTGNVKKFEHKFKDYIKTKNCVAVNNGTSALELALSVFDLQNKEVILPSLSFVSTANAVVINGGIPIFVDVDPNTLCIDPDQIKKHISKKTKIILPVHFGGFPANLQEIMKICKDNGVNLIEDAAHAAGSSYKSKKIGCYGDLTCFSFHPVKNLAMPTGGLISINMKNHQEISTTIKEKRWCGISNRSGASYDVTTIGGNYYMNEFSAAIGLVQLQKLDRLNQKRKKIAKLYYKKINLENKMLYDEHCSYHLYWIRVKNRNQFRKRMSNIGIETGIHYRPIHTFSVYKNKTNLPITEKIGHEIVSLPIHPNLTENEILRIINAVNKFS